MKHLVYYPCPLARNEENGDDSILDLIELLEDAEIVARLRQQTPLRFEFDPAAGTEDHAVCHLHISRDSCRVPVYAPLRVGRFVRFVFRHSYPEAWHAHEFLREWNCPDLNSVISLGQQQELYLRVLRAGRLEMRYCECRRRLPDAQMDLGKSSRERNWPI
jgi:hypothetical protein